MDFSAWIGRETRAADRLDEGLATRWLANPFLWRLRTQVRAVARLFGDQGQQQQFQIARGKYTRASSTAFTAGALLETIRVHAMLAVVGVMMFAHVLFALCIS